MNNAVVCPSIRTRSDDPTPRVHVFLHLNRIGPQHAFDSFPFSRPLNFSWLQATPSFKVTVSLPMIATINTSQSSRQFGHIGFLSVRGGEHVSFLRSSGNTGPKSDVSAPGLQSAIGAAQSDIRGSKSSTTQPLNRMVLSLA